MHIKRLATASLFCYNFKNEQFLKFKQTFLKRGCIMELKGKIINFLGDSITRGYGVEREENVYHQRIKSRFGLAAANNYGISGTRIAKQRKPSAVASYDRYFSSRIDELDEKADAVVVFGGVNDWIHGDAPRGKMEDRTVDTFCGGLHVLYEGLIKIYPGKPIVVVTPLQCNLGLDSFEKPDGVFVLDDYVDIIRKVAKFYSLAVCDMRNLSGIDPKIPSNKEAYAPDGLHPNDAGHEIIAEILGDFLYNL